MKSAMTVRPIDDNGRIVIPKHLLNDIFKVKENEKISVEVLYDEDKIILKRFRPPCVFCDNRENLIDFNGVKICPDCLEKLKKL